MNGPLARRASALALLVVSFALAALGIRFQPYVDHEIRALGAAAYPIAIAVFAIVASAPFSVTDALAIMNGAIFGPVMGSIVNAIGIVCAAMVGYAVARRTCHLLDLDKQIARLPGWVTRFRGGSPGFLLAVRVIPGFGGTVATQVAAAFKVPLFVHIWTMSAIAIPICTLLAVFGDRVSVAVHDYYVAHRPHVHMHFPFHHRPPENPH